MADTVFLVKVVFLAVVLRRLAVVAFLRGALRVLAFEPAAVVFLFRAGFFFIASIKKSLIIDGHISS